jgi:23S rRNA pseudouridine1911/1915/1917 synthase
MEEYAWHIGTESAGERLDKVVASYHTNWSRVQVQDWIKRGLVKVDKEVKKGNYRVKIGEMIEIFVPPVEVQDIKPEPMKLEIVYEDRDVIVVNKPRGMVVHPGAGNFSGTLLNGLMAHTRNLSKVGGQTRLGIVHRIDKDTSGLLMVAKNDVAHRALVEQLKEHSVERKYVAIVHGVIPHQHGTIEAPIGRDPKQRQRMAVVEQNGKDAVTHFTVLERFKDTTLVECRLETGRTHQIRVHMKYIGFPLVGDPIYGPKKSKYSIEGQALHAQVLGFTHPRTGERIRKEVDPPEEFQQLLEKMRKESKKEV